MTTADPRLRKAVARLILPEPWTTEHLRRLAHNFESSKQEHLAKLCQTLADRLDGTVPEAIERALDKAAAAGFVGGRSQRVWNIDVQPQAMEEGRRALTPLPDRSR